MVEYLRRYAAGLDVDIRTVTRVEAVAASADGFLVRTCDGETYRAAGIVAASGSFGNPYIPVLPGQETFGGNLLHVSEYRDPEQFAGQRVVVVGAGNSAVQVGYELAEVAEVTLATRRPIDFIPQRQDGKDLHYWLRRTGFDEMPPEWLARIVTTTLVLDTGDYRNALDTGRMDRRPMFEAFDGNKISWPNDAGEKVDTVLFATGYRPHLGYLEPLGALANGLPRHAGGISVTHPGLVYVGLEFQRSFSSNTLRGVHRDAGYVVPALGCPRDRSRSPGQWPPVKVPASAVCRCSVSSFIPVIVTVVPRAAYLVVMASSEATVEASQMCAPERSITTLDGSFA